MNDLGGKGTPSTKKKGLDSGRTGKLSGLSLRTIISYEKKVNLYPKKRSTYDVLAEIFEIPSVELRSRKQMSLTSRTCSEIPENMMEVIRIFNDPDLSGEEVMAQLHELLGKAHSSE